MPTSRDCKNIPITWPKWLLDELLAIEADFQSISEITHKYYKDVDGGHIYQHVMQSELTFVTDKLIKEGYLSAEGKILKKAPPLPRQAEMAQFNQSGIILVILDSLTATKKMALVQLLKTTSFCLNDGNLFVAYICLRSAIEHIAHLGSVVKLLKKVDTPKNFDQANKIFFETYGKLAKINYATRVDWKNLDFENEEELLNKDKIKYQQRTDRMDLEAKTILNGIDDLSKKVKGIRSIYEILCEFAHPNAGVAMAITRSVDLLEDKSGFNWVRKEFSLAPPISSIKDINMVHKQIFSKMAESLRYSEKLFYELSSQKEKMRDITQFMLRQIISNRKDLVDLYSPCPCSSGKKIKFCCGATAH